MDSPTRRRFLTSTALVAAGFGLGVRPASALSIEPADAATTADYQTAMVCRRASTEHVRLAAEAAALVAGRDLSEAERQTVVAAFTCPICGCLPFTD